MSRHPSGSESSVSDDSQLPDLVGDAAGNQGVDAAPEEDARYASLHTHRSVCTPSPTTCYRAPVCSLTPFSFAPSLHRSNRSFAPLLAGLARSSCLAKRCSSSLASKCSSCNPRHPAHGPLPRCCALSNPLLTLSDLVKKFDFLRAQVQR